jgi:hypothetical protein
LFTDDDVTNPPVVNIPAGDSTQIDVALGLPIEAVTTVTVVIVPPTQLWVRA